MKQQRIGSSRRPYGFAVIMGIGLSLLTAGVQAQTFAPYVTNPFNLTGLGGMVETEFADIDNDGDLDLFICSNYGNWGAEIIFFENTGTRIAPHFATPVVNPYGFPYFGGVLSPTFVDIDNDGDLDFFCGNQSGESNYFENTGTATAPVFGPLVVGAFQMYDIGYFSSHDFADIDNDGDQDVIIGEYYGNLLFFPNIGTAEVPSFGNHQTLPFGLSNTGLRPKPTFLDLDKDGDQDLLVGLENGSLVYFQNTGTPTAPAFSAPVVNPFGLTNVGTVYASPSLADLDLDGDMDLLCGENTNVFYYFENTSPLPQPPNVTITTPISDLTVCYGSGAILTAAGTPIGTIGWYDLPIGGNRVGTGSPFISAPITGNTTFYAQDSTGGGISPGRVAVMVSATQPIADQTVSAVQGSLCQGGSTAINVNGSEAGLTYYLRNDLNDSVVAGPIIGTGNALSFNTGPLATTTYHVLAEKETPLPHHALAFDGVDDYITTPAGVNLANQSFTVEFWAKRIINGADNYVVGQQSSQTVNNSLHIGFRSGNNFTFAFYGNDLDVASTAVTDGNFHHWSCVFMANQPGTNRFIYLDGNLIASDEAQANYSGSGPLYIGTVPFAAAYFNGTLDELKIWNQARTATEVQQDMQNNALSGNQPGLLAYYDMEETVGTTSLLDKTSHNNDGTLQNMNPATAWVAGDNSAAEYRVCQTQMSQTATVIIKHPALHTVSVTLCHGENYQYADGTMGLGITANESHISTLTGEAANGCDSIVTETIVSLPELLGSFTATLCAEESITLNGTVYDALNTSGTEIFIGAGPHGCDSSVTVNLTMLPTLSGSITTTLCAEESITVNGTVYDASNPSGTEVFSNVGIYGCDSTVTVSLTVLPALSGSVTTSICAEESITINGTVYNVSNPSGTEVFTNVGTYGCDSTVAVNLTVLPALTGSVTTAICANESLTINGTVYDATNLSGTEIFTGVGPNGCDSTVVVTLTLNPPVDVTTTTAGNIITANQPGAVYQWISCATNTPILGAVSQTFIPTENGAYAVVVTDLCSDTSDCVNIVTLGVEELSTDVLFNAYPNPTNGLFTIDVNEAVSIKITNVAGQLILGRLLEIGKTTIYLEDVESGIYFVSAVNNGNRIAVQRIVIIK